MTKSSRYSKRAIKQLEIDDMKIDYLVLRRNVKYPRLEFRPEALYVILPQQIEDESGILKRKENWIRRKYERIRELYDLEEYLFDKFPLFGEYYDVKDGSEINELRIDFENKEIEIDSSTHLRQFTRYLRKMLKNRLLEITKEYSKELNEDFDKMSIRTQKTKWSSCSSQRNLSFNLKIAALSEDLVRYIVYHELLHLKHEKHGPDFVNALKQKFENYKEIERTLFKHWFTLNRYKIWTEILE